MAISWAAKRQLTYGSIVLLVLLILFGTPTYFVFFNKAPSCTDGVQNQGEQGIDCGGPCSTACANQVVPLPVTLWTRAFPVASGIYNLVAYEQNANVSYTSLPAKYLFRVYDSDNVLIDVREGYTSVPPTKNFPVFEQGFNAGERIPAKVFFEFIDTPSWQKYDGSGQELQVKDAHFSDATTTATSSQPQLLATLSNTTINGYKNVEVVAIIYDQDGNAMAASRTVVDSLDPKGTHSLIFTWPHPFPSSYSKIEIIPKLVI